MTERSSSAGKVPKTHTTRDHRIECLWGDLFMKKQWQREWKMLPRYTSRICFWTVFTAFGGILLWVHGSSAALVYRAGILPSFVPCFTLCFLLWLLAYALTGCALGILLLPASFRIPMGRKESLVCLLTYLLMLSWYPLFFSLLHPFLCTMLLLTAVLLNSWLFVRAVKRLSVVMIPQFFSCLLEIYFLCVTFAVLLVN